MFDIVNNVSSGLLQMGMVGNFGLHRLTDRQKMTPGSVAMYKT